MGTYIETADMVMIQAGDTTHAAMFAEGYEGVGGYSSHPDNQLIEYGYWDGAYYLSRLYFGWDLSGITANNIADSAILTNSVEVKSDYPSVSGLCIVINNFTTTPPDVFSIPPNPITYWNTAYPYEYGVSYPDAVCSWSPSTTPSDDEINATGLAHVKSRFGNYLIFPCIENTYDRQQTDYTGTDYYYDYVNAPELTIDYSMPHYGSITLPRLQMNPVYANLTIQLASLIVSGKTGFVANIDFPKSRLIARAITGAFGSGQLIIPGLDNIAHSGKLGSVNINSFVVDGYCSSGILGTFRGTISLRLTGSGVVDQIANAALRLPSLLSISDSVTGVKATFSYELPAMIYSGSALSGLLGDLNKVLPSLRVDGSAIVLPTGQYTNALPKFHLDAVLSHTGELQDYILRSV